MAKKKHNDNAFLQTIKNRSRENKLIDSAFMVNHTLMMYILHAKFGFGGKRLNKFTEEFEDLLDSYNKGYLNFDDIRGVLKDECGIEVRAI